MPKLLTKTLLRNAACLVSEDSALGLTGYTCLAVQHASGDTGHYRTSPASRAYAALAIACGAPDYMDNDRLLTGSFTVYDASGAYDIEASNALRFDFLNLLAESL